MTMLSFRVDDADAARVGAWAQRLGIDRSELLRDAVRGHLSRLASEDDARIWENQPLDAGEEALSAVAEWGPAEDWSDWDEAGRSDAAG